MRSIPPLARLQRVVTPTLAMLLLSAAAAGHAQVVRLGELNTRQVQELDRDRTVIIIPFGILEQHGPYLPSYADGIVAGRLADDLAAALAREGFAAAVFPTIPLGAGPANEIGGRFAFPGSYPVRAATVRAIVMDLAAEFGEQGFRRIVVVSMHGAPSHNRVLDEASRFYRDEYRGRMLAVFDAVALSDAWTVGYDSAALQEDGFSVHSGIRETSELMFLRSDLVARDVASAPSLAGRDMAALRALATAPGWPGYFGAPRRASAASGRRSYEATRDLVINTTLRFLRGTPHRPAPGYLAVTAGDSTNAMIDRAAASRDSALAARQQRWLEADRDRRVPR